MLCSDEELMVEIIVHHSHPALALLHERYSGKLYGYFLKMMNDREKASDFVQDIFLKIMEKKHLFDPERKFQAWIFTIASNMCKTAFRSPQFVALSSEEIDQKSHGHLSENLHEKERFKILYKRSLNQLEMHHKTTFILRYMENFSLNDIAEITGVSVGTVKSRLFYATQKMTKLLHEYDPRQEINLFKIN